ATTLRPAIIANALSSSSSVRMLTSRSGCRTGGRWYRRPSISPILLCDSATGRAAREHCAGLVSFSRLCMRPSIPSASGLETSTSSSKACCCLSQISNHFCTFVGIDPFMPPHHREHRNQCRCAIEQRKCGGADARHEMALVEGIAFFAHLRDEPLDAGVV